MNSLTTIRKAVPADMAEILELVRELAVFEKAPDAVLTTLQDYEINFKSGVFDALMAEDGEGKVVGIALYYISWSTWKGRTLYLEDFIVKQRQRGNGIGKIIFDALTEEAHKLNCNQMKWQVLDWNEAAVNFYKKYPVEIEKDWWNVRLTAATLRWRNMAGRSVCQHVCPWVMGYGKYGATSLTAASLVSCFASRPNG